MARAARTGSDGFNPGGRVDTVDNFRNRKNEVGKEEGPDKFHALRTAAGIPEIGNFNFF